MNLFEKGYVTKKEIYEEAFNSFRERKELNNFNLLYDLLESNVQIQNYIDRKLNNANEANHQKIIGMELNDILSIISELLQKLNNNNYDINTNLVLNKIVTKSKKVKRLNYEQLNRIIIEEINEIIIDKFQVNEEFYNEINRKEYDMRNKKIFLSYSYSDKMLTFALFIIFMKFGCYLYIDWMHNNLSGDGINLKYELQKAMDTSIAFVLLKTTNSQVVGKTELKQWCAWESGYYRAKNNDKKFILNTFKDDKGDKNIFFDSFRKTSEIPLLFKK